MGFWQSVRFKIVLGFALILAPMVAFLVYNNLYASSVVRNQVAANFNQLFNMNVQENDNILNEYKYYLYRLQREPDIPIIQALPSDADEYVLAKLRILNRLALDSVGIYYSLDSIFLYTPKEQSLIFATQVNENSDVKQSDLLKWSKEHLSGPIGPEDGTWQTIELSDGSHYLLKTVDLDLNVYAGALVPMNSMMRLLRTFDVGPDGGTLLIGPGGTVLSGSMDTDALEAGLVRSIQAMSGTTGTVKYGDMTYLVMKQSSKFADVEYVLMTTESYVLKNLPFFQKVLYIWIPLLVAFSLSLYLLFLQRVMFKPLARLIGGMRKLGQGRFEIRLPPNRSSEFSFMSSTFNQMAGQIERLKIDVYEEQLRVQKAEYKHLQVQINPHFYMNSLNIIYNLAALKDFKSVQKLSLHLADYFRFLMQSHRTVVRLEDELRHIRHYLEIQKVRYVTKLDYTIEVPQEHQQAELSPLMIQPFVENAMIHGFNRRVQDGSPYVIRIHSEEVAAGEADSRPEKATTAGAGSLSAAPEGGEAGSRFIRIVVEDNGPGFPEEILRDLESGDYLSGTGEQHLGIWNILRRYKMLYGDAGGIEFRNAEGGGAVVTIRLPLMAGQAGQEGVHENLTQGAG